MNTTCIVFLVNQLSIRFAIDENGTKEFDASYDAWGKQTVTLNTIGLLRGYTGHEMIHLVMDKVRILDPLCGVRYLQENIKILQGKNKSFYNFTIQLDKDILYVQVYDSLKVCEFLAKNFIYE